MTWVLAALEARSRQASRTVRQAALAPTLVRVVILVAASASMFLAYPPTVVLQLVILLPALFPRGMMPSVFIGLALLMWLVSGDVNPATITLWRVVALAITLYVVHIGSALAAVLPYDAVLTPGVFRPWILRGALVSVLTAAVGTFVFALQQAMSDTHRSLGATVGGFVLLITTAILLSYLGNKRQ
jgi:hypothetical protein